MSTSLDEQPVDEAAKVLGWRLERLREMRDQRGERFTPAQARQLAAGGIDLHEAAAILAAGCSIPTAYRILS